MCTFYNDMDDTFYLLEQQKDGTYKVLERFRDLEYLQEEYGLFGDYTKGSEYIYEFSLDDPKGRIIPIGRYNTEEENKHSLCSFKIGGFYLNFYFKEKPKGLFDYHVPKIPSDDDDIIVELKYYNYYLTLKFSMLNKFIQKLKGISSKEILEKEFIFEEFHYEKERKEVCAFLEVNSNKNLLQEFLNYYGN